jgi:4'-phosphopantetheinyl transferase
MASSVTVWLADARSVDPDALATYRAWLGEGERMRMECFVRDVRRQQFLIGRGLLRQGLGRVLGVAPSEVVLEERPGQAPRLCGVGSGVAEFSLSHSGPWIACAVSADTAVGVDIEAIDLRRDVLSLAQAAFSAEQCAWLSARPEADRARAFYELWSLAEARIKLNAEPQDSYVLPHPALSIVLCSARPLRAAPLLTPASMLSLLY